METTTAALEKGPPPQPGQIIEGSFLESAPPLKEWQKLAPGSPVKFLDVYIANNASRRELEKKKQDYQFQLHAQELKLQARGQMFAFVITMTAVLGGFLLATVGKLPISGTLLSGGSLAAVITAFVTVRKTERHTTLNEQKRTLTPIEQKSTS